MTKSPGDKIWRTVALVILCGLVYYFSYDHGREAVRRDLEALRLSAGRELEVQRGEILRLRNALAECVREKTAPPAPSPPAASPAPAAPAERLTLRSGQSKIIFDGQLVVTLLQVAGTENRALVQLNFLSEERLATENLSLGGSFKFSFDNRDWALVASSMSISSVALNLVELKKNEDL